MRVDSSLKVFDKSNAVLCKIGQQTDELWERGQIVVFQAKPMKESD